MPSDVSLLAGPTEGHGHTVHIQVYTCINNNKQMICTCTCICIFIVYMYIPSVCNGSETKLSESCPATLSLEVTVTCMCV